MSDEKNPSMIKIAADEGEHFAVAGATLNWKLRSRQAGADFCFFEQILEPGEGVPLHTHSYPEAFYVLSGTIEFASAEASGEPSRCYPGDVILAPARTEHSFYNRGPVTARLLSISVGRHELFFDAIAAADRSEPFAALPQAETMARVAAIGAQTDTNFVPASDHSTAPDASS